MGDIRLPGEFSLMPAEIERMKTLLTTSMTHEDQAERDAANREFMAVPRVSKISALLGVYKLQEASEELRLLSLTLLYGNLRCDWSTDLLPSWGINDLLRFRNDLLTLSTEASAEKIHAFRLLKADIIAHVSRQPIDGRVREWRELSIFLLATHEHEESRLMVFCILCRVPRVLGLKHVPELAKLIGRSIYNEKRPLVVSFALFTYPVIIEAYKENEKALEHLGCFVPNFITIAKGSWGNSLLICLDLVCRTVPRLFLVPHLAKLFHLCVEVTGPLREFNAETAKKRTSAFFLLRFIFDSHWKETVAQCGNDAIDRFGEQLIFDAQLENGDGLTNVIIVLAKKRAEEGNPWTAFEDLVRICLTCDNVYTGKNGLSIIAAVPSVITKDMLPSALDHIKRSAMRSDHPIVQSAAYLAYIALVSENKKQIPVEIQQAFTKLFAFITQKIVYENAESRNLSFVYLHELANSATSVLQPYLPTVLDLCIQDIYHYCESATKTAFPASARAIASLCQNEPDMLNQLGLTSDTVNCAVTLAATDLERDNERNWMEMTRLDLCTESARLLDDILSAFCPNLTLPILLEMHDKSRDNDDGKEQLKGVVALMEAGERIRGREGEEMTVLRIISCLTNSTVRVRHLAIASLLRILTLWTPLILEKYHENIIPALISRIVDLSVPRVSAHAALALTTFIHSCPEDIMVIHFDGMAESLLECLSQLKKMAPDTHGIVLGEVLLLISSLAKALPKGVAKFYHPLMIKIKPILSDEIHYAKAITCLSQIGFAMEKEMFQADAKNIMVVLSSRMDSLLNDDSIADCLSRLSSIIDLPPFLPTLMPPIMSAATDEGWDLGKSKQVAMKILLSLATREGDSFVPYIDEVSSLVILSLSETNGDSSWAYQMAPIFLRIVKTQGKVADLWNKVRPAFMRMEKGEGKKEEQEYALSQCLEQLGDEATTPKEETISADSDEVTCTNGEDDH